MIRLLIYKDMYVPVVNTKKNLTVAKAASYFIFRKRKLDFEELHALVSNEFGGRTSPRLKHFLHSYIKKLEGYGLAEVCEVDGKKMIIAKADAFPLRWVVHGILNDPVIQRKVDKRVLVSWKRGERKPNIERLLEVII